MGKRILFVVLGMLILFSGCKERSEKQAKDGNISWIRFEWMGDTLGGRYFERAAMYLPFRIEGVPYVFKSQFDLGAPHTMFYGNTVRGLFEHYPFLAERLDTVNKRYVIQGRRVGEFVDITFFLDTVRFNHQTVVDFEGFGDTLPGEDLSQLSKKIIIGTVGSNLFRDKVLVIDFPGKRLAIMDSLLPDIDTGELVDIQLVQGMVIIPVIIDGEKYFVLYDTGSSIASLFLSTRNWDKFRDTLAPVDTIVATAWGQEFKLFLSPTKINVTIGSHVLRPGQVMANAREDYYNFYKQLGIIGLMGNDMFRDNVIVIDYRDKKFGIIH